MDLKAMKERLAAILASLEGFKGVDLSQDQVEEINALDTEFSELSAKISAAEKLEAISARAETSARKTNPLPTVEVKASRKELNGGFTSTGEYLMAVKRAAHGDVDKRFQNVMFERNGEDGGYAVPSELETEITKKVQADESLLPKTNVISVSGNNLSIVVDENAPWSGGVQAYWTAEGAQIQASQQKLGMASWKLQKLAAMVVATDELLDDATALESYIRGLAPIAIQQKINEAILTGNGVGKPMGILNSGFKVEVAKESGQAADTVVAANVLKMYSKMLPASRAKAAWYINPQVEEQLRQMVDPNGNYLYIAPGGLLNQTPFGTLLGRPVIPMMGGLPQLGDAGDIIFADLSYYYSIVKAGGMKNAISTHLYFDRDQTAFKFTMRVDGSCPFKAPVTTQYGSYAMSGIVTLEAR